MPRSSIVYWCGTCMTRHAKYKDAQNCETLPVPVQEFAIGDTITFENENCLGLRSRYNLANGTVLAIIINSLINNLNKPVEHAIQYVVAMPGYETVVEKATNPQHQYFGNYFSKAENKFTPGYANNLKQDLESFIRETTLC